MNEFIRGIRRGFPICLGYLPVSFTLGIMAIKSGVIPIVAATLMSFTNMASAGQLNGINLIEIGAEFVTIAITTFVINLRYMLMSFTLTQKIPTELPWYKRMIMAYGITDEVFAFATMEKGEIKFPFFLGLMTLPIIGWTTGTFLGAFATELFPPMIQGCMGLALYCMFIAVIIPEARQGRKVSAIIGISILLTCLMTYVPGIKVLHAKGWDFIIAAVVAAAAGASMKEINRRRKRARNNALTNEQ